MPKRYAARGRTARRPRRFATATRRKPYARRSRAPAARRRRRIARDFAPAIPGLKGTKTVWLTHRTMQTFNLTNASAGNNTQVFVTRANAPYDPEYALGGTAATGFAYYAAQYTKYRCTESTQQVKFICTGQNGYASGVALIVHDLQHADEVNGLFGPASAGPIGATGGLILSTLKPGASHRLVTSGGGSPVTMFRRYNSRAAFGVAPGAASDEALVNNIPDRLALYKVIVTNNGFEGASGAGGAMPDMLGTVMITTRYKVKFISPKDMTTLM